MNYLSPYIIAAAFGWIMAQCAKYILHSVRLKRPASIRELYQSGRMPSSHSASAIAVLVVVAGIDGIQSGLFGVTFFFVSVILYDAMMVRRSSGEQGIALTLLIEEKKSNVPLPRVAMGHTPLEVAVGSLLGLAVGLAVLLVHNVYW